MAAARSCADVQGADADHHGVEIAELLGGEIRTGQRGHLVAHLLQAFGHVSPAPET